ncbi:MAG: iron chaperone [Candidatus Limnocylindrales bacterium]
MTDTKRSTKRGNTARTSGDVFSNEELAAMQETIRERKKASKLSAEEARIQGEADVQAKIAEMAEDDRAIAARIHEIVLATAPELVPRTFYGMPAYARDGKVICFFQAKSKFKVRYSTLGFQPDARLDEGDLWPVAFAVNSLTPAGEKRIVGLVKKAAG